MGKVERMLFQVTPHSYAKDFLLADAEVWNPWLKRQVGFLNKETRVVGNGLVELVLFWKDQGSLDKAAAKRAEMLVVDQMMKQRSPAAYTLVSSTVS